MIAHVWLFYAVVLCAMVLSFLFLRFGITSSRTLEHPLMVRFMPSFSGRRFDRLPALFLCAALILAGTASSGVRWGVVFLSEYNEARVLGLLYDKSGSIGEEQHKLIKSAIRNFLGKFKDSATVSVGPFADRASPGPLFTLSVKREYDAAMAFIDNIEEIEVGGGTEGGWALYQMFSQLMSPSKIPPEKMRGEILPWLRNREILQHEKEIVGLCKVRDRAVIIETDADFSESQLHSAEVLELYRICGVRAYMMSVKGSSPQYLIDAVNATGGRFKLFPADLANDNIRFAKLVSEYFNDVLAVEQTPQKIREVVNPISRSWIFAAGSLGLGGGASLATFASLLAKGRSQKGGG